MNPTENAVLLVLCNLPDVELARQVARELVERRLAACVNLLPAVESTYRWQGQIDTASEVPILIKTSRHAYPALEAALQELHPYDLPEIIALPAAAGLAAYLSWVLAETEPA